MSEQEWPMPVFVPEAWIQKADGEWHPAVDYKKRRPYMIVLELHENGTVTWREMEDSDVG